jgi:hypothetical protein
LFVAYGKCKIFEEAKSGIENLGVIGFSKDCDERLVYLAGVDKFFASAVRSSNVP